MHRITISESKVFYLKYVEYHAINVGMLKMPISKTLIWDKGFAKSLNVDCVYKERKCAYKERRFCGEQTKKLPFGCNCTLHPIVILVRMRLFVICGKMTRMISCIVYHVEYFS